jgi:formylmethanofuran dehydrogenase subunit B
MSRGYPRYNPGEFSANELLAERDADLCLLVGAETVPFLSDAAKTHLRSIPTVVLDYPGASLDWVPTVRFTTSVYGLNAGGTIYRMDNVPVALKALQTSDAPTDEEVLTQLRQHC